MEHTEFLAKVKVARKHRKEYKNQGTAPYLAIGICGLALWLILSLFLNALSAHYNMASVIADIAPYLSRLAITSCFVMMVGVLSGLYKMELNMKEFKQIYKEEANLIELHESALKDK